MVAPIARTATADSIKSLDIFNTSFMKLPSIEIGDPVLNWKNRT